MRILELFAGSRSFGKVAEKRGHDVFSVDWKQFDGIDLVIDIEYLTEDLLPWIPDVVIDGRYRWQTLHNLLDGCNITS